MEEGEIVKRCQANDAEAQRILYEKYADKMYGICFRYLSEETSAEDAVTEGFLKVFEKIQYFEYRGKGSLTGWIKRIVVNESLMILRKRKHKLVDIDCSSEKENGQNIDQSLLEEDIISEIRKLPKGYRTVFNLYAIEGYSHKEIGEKLGISENTSKSQLSKARASLMKSLVKIGAI